MTDTVKGEQAEALVAERLEQLLSGYNPETEPQEFWGKQYDLGLAWVQFPQGFGGLGVSPRYQSSVDQAIEGAGAPTWNRELNLLGIGMGAGVLAAHGTDEQKAKWLRPMFTTEDMWCQLFSEPGAGSDLPTSQPRQSGTVTNGSSTVRRSGRRWPT